MHALKHTLLAKAYLFTTWSSNTWLGATVEVAASPILGNLQAQQRVATLLVLFHLPYARFTALKVADFWSEDTVYISGQICLCPIPSECD